MKINTPFTRIVTKIARLTLAKRVDLPHTLAFLYNNSFKKLSNLINIELEKRLKRITLKSKPYIMFLEVNNICNLHCPFCMTGKGVYGGREKRHMTIDDVKGVIDQTWEHLYFIQLYNWGEPMLNKDIFEIIRYAKSKNIFTMASSNMTALDEGKIDRLIDSGLDYLKVAVDGVSKESYSLYRVGADFDKVMENFKTLMRRRKEKGSRFPIVEWQFVVFKHNEDEVDEAQKIADELGVDYFNPIPAYIEDAKWIPKNEKYKATLYDPESVRKCRRLWSHINVRCDGGIAPCCYEFFKKDDFGNIFKRPFAELWNNDIFKYSRELCMHPDKVTKERKMDTICYNCIIYEKRPSLNVEDILKQEEKEEKPGG